MVLNRRKNYATDQHEAKKINTKFVQYVFSVVLQLNDYIEENELSRRMWGRYLHNEWK